MLLQRRLLGVTQERPSENFELNSDNPLAQKLDGVFLAGAYLPINLVTGVIGSFKGTVNLVPDALGGIGWRTGGVSGDYVDLGDAPAAIGTGDFTFAFWATYFGSFSYHRYFSWGAENADPADWWQSNDNATIGLVRGGTVLLAGTPGVSAGNTYFWAATRKGTDTRVYQNGAEFAQGAVSSNFFGVNVNLGRGAIGNRENVNSKFSACYFGRQALTAPEINSLYDPATRWDLISRPRVMMPGFMAPAGNKGADSRNRAWGRSRASRRIIIQDDERLVPGWMVR